MRALAERGLRHVPGGRPRHRTGPGGPGRTGGTASKPKSRGRTWHPAVVVADAQYARLLARARPRLELRLGLRDEGEPGARFMSDPRRDERGPPAWLVASAAVAVPA
jgi:hypothetical protein